MDELRGKFSQFLNKKIIVRRRFTDRDNNNVIFTFKGICVDITENQLFLDDFKKGTTVFFLNEISVEPLEELGGGSP